jgi:hypothetical protein
VSFILTAIGLLLLTISLGGVALGLYMAAEPKTRARGILFAVLWLPGLAATSGVLMRDVVTFTVGVLCFLVAGAVFILEGDRPYEPPAEKKGDLATGLREERLLDAEKSTKENRTQSSGRAAS